MIDERYEIAQLLGTGGFGEVYRALDRRTGRSVALKVMLSERLIGRDAQREAARFEREAKVLGQLQHPNIVPLIDAGCFQGRLYMVIAYIVGQDMSRVLEQEGPMPLAQAKHVMLQVLDALCAAHDQGVVHRDLKPANIMLSSSGGRRNAMVLDFGIAGLLETGRDADYSSLTAVGAIPGTPLYMAPEQFLDGPMRVNPSIDVYAWGLIFIELLSGKPAIKSESLLAIMHEQTSANPVLLPEQVSATPIGPIIARCVEKDVSRRFARPKDVLAAIDPSTALVSSIEFVVTGDVPSLELRNTGESISDVLMQADPPLAAAPAAPPEPVVAPISRPKEGERTQQPVVSPAPSLLSSRWPWLLLAGLSFAALFLAILLITMERSQSVAGPVAKSAPEPAETIADQPKAEQPAPTPDAVSLPVRPASKGLSPAPWLVAASQGAACGLRRQRPAQHLDGKRPKEPKPKVEPKPDPKVEPKPDPKDDAGKKPSLVTDDELGLDKPEPPPDKPKVERLDF
jgi:serine/threonine protein kinase